MASVMGESWLILLHDTRPPLRVSEIRCGVCESKPPPSNLALLPNGAVLA
jgi:hypothetical protein